MRAAGDQEPTREDEAGAGGGGDGGANPHFVEQDIEQRVAGGEMEQRVDFDGPPFVASEPGETVGEVERRVGDGIDAHGGNRCAEELVGIPGGPVA